MSSFRFLTLHLLLLTAVCVAQYYDYTTTPDYDPDSLDGDLAIDYSFYSNTTNEELEKFLDSLADKLDVSVPTATSEETTEKGRVDLPATETSPGSGSLRVSLELKMLVWTLMILMVLS